MPFENEVSCLKRSNLFRDLDDQELHAIASRLKQQIMRRRHRRGERGRTG